MPDPAIARELVAAREIAATRWGVDGDVRALPSYADLNFLIAADGARHVLKIAHPSWRREELDLENQAMLTLAEREPALAWPAVRRTPDGAHLLTLTVDDVPRHVRLLGYVEGRVYAEAIAEVAPAQRPALHRSLGAAVARMARGLADFVHESADRVHPWNLLQLPTLLDEIAHIDDAALRDRVDCHARAICAQLPAWRARLPIQVLHNDANDLNVIVDCDADGAPHVASIIDFGDMCTTFRIADLAIACTYAMQHESDPVACARAVLAGYESVQPLLPEERALLQTFIVARLCHSVLMATRAWRLAPENDYILVSQQGVRALLRLLTAPDAPVAVPDAAVADAQAPETPENLHV